MLSWIRHRGWPAFYAAIFRWNEDDGNLLSAAMAYYATLSIFPLCLVLVAGLGLVMQYSQTAQSGHDELLHLVSQNASPWLSAQLAALLEGIRTRARLGGPLGLLFLIVTSIGIFAQFEAAFCRIWRVTTGTSRGVFSALKNALYDRLFAFLMMLGTVVLLLVLFIVNLVLAGLLQQAARLPGGNYLWQLNQALTPLLLNAALFTLIFRVIPRVSVRWRDALAGGVFVACIWGVGQRVLSAFVISDRYSVYGVVGSLIAVMLWIYYSSAVIFLGAEFVRALGDPSAADSGKEPEARTNGNS
jgi:membrane protein